MLNAEAASEELAAVQEQIENLWDTYELCSNFTEEQTELLNVLYNRKVALKTYLGDYLKHELQYRRP